MIPRLIAGKEEMTQFLLEYINSGEWWLLMPARNGGSHVIDIEQRYYSGEASKDFIAVLAPTNFGLLSIYLAHKRRMTPDQLFDLLKDDAALPITVSQLEKRDIIFLAGWQESQRMIAALAELTQR